MVGELNTVLLHWGWAVQELNTASPKECLHLNTLFLLSNIPPYIVLHQQTSHPSGYIYAGPEELSDTYESVVTSTGEPRMTITQRLQPLPAHQLPAT
jgi:hypothetical protein